VIAATANEAPYVLDGLLYHQSSLIISEHYTDTGGFSDHVFVMCRLLGFLFAPRIRDLKEKRLYILPGMKVPPELAALVAGAKRWLRLFGGCWRDNVFVERLWKSVKYEEVYLHAYDSVSEAKRGLEKYFTFYNQRRPHTALDDKTPDEFYFDNLPVLPKQRRQ